jgi:hypothetical protein
MAKQAKRPQKRVLRNPQGALQTIVNRKAATPFAQRNLLNTSRAVFEWAVGEGRVPDNPVRGVKRRNVKTTGYTTWSEAYIERIEAAHPIGTKERPLSLKLAVRQDANALSERKLRPRPPTGRGFL